MEKEILKFIFGMCFIVIVPIIVKRQFQSGTVFSGKIENDKKVIYIITITTFSFLAIINQNNDILLGTIIGCALFQLLGVYGVNKLTRIKEQKKELISKGFWKKKRKEYNNCQKKETYFLKYSYGSQYLIFCAILLLFLSADYLLRKEATENILSKIDGGLLLFLFLVYLYIVYGKKETSFLQSMCMNKCKNQLEKKENNLSKQRIARQIFEYILLIVVIAIGNHMLFESVSKIGVKIEISQYCIGLTLMTWCINLSGILLTWFNSKKKNRIENLGMQLEDSNDEIENDRNNMENISEEVLFSMTMLLGTMALIKPIMVNMYIIYDLILFGIVVIMLQFIQKIDNRLAGSGMATVYIGFIVYAIIR